MGVLPATATAEEEEGDDADASANEGEDAVDEVRSIGVLAFPAPAKASDRADTGSSLSGAATVGDAAVGMGASEGQYAAALTRGEVEDEVGDEAARGREAGEADRGAGALARDEECDAAAAGWPAYDWPALWYARLSERAADCC